MHVSSEGYFNTGKDTDESSPRSNTLVDKAVFDQGGKFKRSRSPLHRHKSDVGKMQKKDSFIKNRRGRDLQKGIIYSFASFSKLAPTLRLTWAQKLSNKDLSRPRSQIHSSEYRFCDCGLISIRMKTASRVRSLSISVPVRDARFCFARRLAARDHVFAAASTRKSKLLLSSPGFGVGTPGAVGRIRTPSTSRRTSPKIARNCLVE